MTRYTADEKRAIAIGAVQAYLRRMDVEPSTVICENAYYVLGDFSRAFPDRIAAEFYQNMSKAQLNKFIRDWDKWRVREQEELAYRMWAKEHGLEKGVK